MAIHALQKIRNAGFSLSSPYGVLVVTPASRLSSTQRAYIQTHTAALLAELTAEEAREERAAIREFDAGYSREEADRLALVAHPYMPTITEYKP